MRRAPGNIRQCGLYVAHQAHEWLDYADRSQQCPGLAGDLTRVEILERLVRAEKGDFFNAEDLRVIAQAVLDHERRIA